MSEVSRRPTSNGNVYSSLVFPLRRSWAHRVDGSLMQLAVNSIQADSSGGEDFSGSGRHATCLVSTLACRPIKHEHMVVDREVALVHRHRSVERIHGNSIDVES